MEATEKFEVEQAKKLLQNIERYSDIRNVKVLKADSFTMEETTLKEWVKWLHKRIELYGEFGVETQFLNIITRVDTHIVTMSDRVKDGLRHLLTAMDRQEIIIKSLNEKINKLEKAAEELETKEEEPVSKKAEEPEKVVVEKSEVKKISDKEKKEELKEVDMDDENLEDYEE